MSSGSKRRTYANPGSRSTRGRAPGRRFRAPSISMNIDITPSARFSISTIVDILRLMYVNILSRLIHLRRRLLRRLDPQLRRPIVPDDLLGQPDVTFRPLRPRIVKQRRLSMARSLRQPNVPRDTPGV